MRSATAAFAGGLVLGAAALAVTLSHAPISVARVSGREHVRLGSLRQSAEVCQASEALPRGTSAVRLQLFAFTGPRIKLTALAQGRIIARGERAAGWTGGSVTVPIHGFAGARTAVTLCFSLRLNGDEAVSVYGEPTSAAFAAQVQGGRWPGRVRLEDLRPARSSWWSLILPVARRMGLGRAASGTWSVLLIVGLVLGVVTISSRIVLRELS